MKKTLLKKWLIRLAILIVVFGTVVYFYINNQLTQMYGGHTQIVNPKPFNPPQLTTVIKNANILSQDGLKMLGHQNVLIEKGKIIAIGEHIFIPKDSVIIDANNKFLIPGLIDSHVHLFESPNDLLLYVANGVSTVREMSGNKTHIQWRDEIQKGRLGPHLIVASSKLENYASIEGMFNTWTRKDININSKAKAQSIVNTLIDQGYDAIKLGSSLSKDIYIAINQESKKHQLPLIGHFPNSLSFKDLWNSNQKELTHVEEVIKTLKKEFGGYNNKTADKFLNFVTKRSSELVNNLYKHKIAVVTTLQLIEDIVAQKHNINATLNKVQLKYENPGLVEGTPLTSKGLGWLPKVNRYALPDDYPQKYLAGNKIYWQTYAKVHKILLQAMAKKGITILAGTDANNPVMVPGFSLHDELNSLSQAGMTNHQALATATITPAQWLNLHSGVIKVGYQAVLVLLNKNPLINIQNTKTIDTVIINGKVLNRNKLDAMLKAIQQANDESRSVNISREQKEVNL